VAGINGVKDEIVPALGRKEGGVSSEGLRVKREHPTHERA
jgi:hypothetical protein